MYAVMALCLYSNGKYNWTCIQQESSLEVAIAVCKKLYEPIQLFPEKIEKDIIAAIVTPWELQWHTVNPLYVWRVPTFPLDSWLPR